MHFICRSILLMIMVLGIFACTSKSEELGQKAKDNAQKILPQIGKNIALLEDNITKNEIRHYVLAKAYLTDLKIILADKIKENPAYGDLLSGFENELSLDHSTSIIVGLKADMSDLQNKLDNDLKIWMEKGQLEAIIDFDDDVAALLNKTNKNVFNDSLIDMINVMADLSQGKLRRLVQPQTKEIKGSAGQELVGNPKYGSWQSNGSGDSFWAWYGKYRLFSDLILGPVFYHQWYYHRPWSYYNDYGRDVYGSSRDRRNHHKTAQTNHQKTQNYGRKTGRHMSSYANRNAGAGAVSNTSTTSRSRNQSKYTSSGSGAGRSVRRSNQSRGQSRGK